MTRFSTVLLVVALVTIPVNAWADSITAKQISAGLSDNKTELEQEAWWAENMAGKLHEITGRVSDVEKGTFSGYWVTLDIGRDIMVRCGMSNRWDGIAQKIKKGQKHTCRGYVGKSWTAILGIAFSLDAG